MALLSARSVAFDAGDLGQCAAVAPDRHERLADLDRPRRHHCAAAVIGDPGIAARQHAPGSRASRRPARTDRRKPACARTPACARRSRSASRGNSSAAWRIAPRMAWLRRASRACSCCARRASVCAGRASCSARWSSRCASLSRRRRRWRRARCASTSSCANASSRTGAANSAAAVGVGARRSAAKSASVTSVSWPTPQTIGSANRPPRAPRVRR